MLRVGGAAVYATCAVSPAQNDGVVHAALTAAFHEYGVVAAVRYVLMFSLLVALSQPHSLYHVITTLRIFFLII